MAARGRPATPTWLRPTAALIALLLPLVAGLLLRLSGDLRSSLRGCHGASCSDHESNVGALDVTGVVANAEETFLPRVGVVARDLSGNAAASVPGHRGENVSWWAADIDDITAGIGTFPVPWVDPMDANVEEPKRRLKETFIIAFTMSLTGWDALPSPVAHMLLNSITSLKQRGMGSGMPRDIRVNISDDESDVDKLIDIYTGWCTSYPVVDVFLGPSRTRLNVQAVKIAQMYGIPIIVWSFRDAWYAVGFGYDNPLHMEEHAEVDKDATDAKTLLSAWAVALLETLAHGPMTQDLGDMYPDAPMLGDDLSCFRGFVNDTSAAMSAVFEFLDDDPETALRSEELSPSMLALELSGFEPMSANMSWHLNKIYTELLGRTKSTAAWHAKMSHKLVEEPCFQLIMDEPYWTLGYEGVYDVNTPAHELLRRTLTQLFQEGKRTVAFVVDPGMHVPSLQIYLGALGIAKDLNFTRVYSTMYPVSTHAWTFAGLELLGADVLIACGTDVFMHAVLSEINVRTWSYPPQSVVLVTPRLMTLEGWSMATLTNAAAVNYFIQPMPWGALEPGNHSLMFHTVSHFLDAVIPNETTADQVRAWQLAAAYSVAYYVNVNMADRPNNETFQRQVCKASRSGYGIATEMGTLFFNCTRGYAGKREGGGTSLRQLRTLEDEGSSEILKLAAPMAGYIGAPYNNYVPSRPGETAWWLGFKDWFTSTSHTMPSYEQRRMETWPCASGYESNELHGHQRPEAGIHCTACKPGFYFNQQWLRCRPCNDGEKSNTMRYAIHEASMHCHELIVTEPPGGAVFDTPQTVPLAAPGWYRLTGPDEEDAKFFECPHPEFCLGNNTCEGDVVGVLCNSCKPGFERWAHHDEYQVMFPWSKEEKNFCHECDYSAALFRMVALLVIWMCLTALLSRCAMTDAYKVGAVRFASLRLLVFNMQFAALCLGQQSRKHMLWYLASSILVSPWEVTSLECFLNLFWADTEGGQAEWREYVMLFKVYLSLCLAIAGIIFIYGLNLLNLLRTMPAEMLRTNGVCGPIRFLLFAVFGPNLGCLSKWVERGVSKAWRSTDHIDRSESWESFDTPDAGSSHSLAVGPTYTGDPEADAVNAAGDAAEKWPGLPTAFQDPRLCANAGMHDILNDRSRVAQNSQRLTSAWLFLMLPIVLHSITSLFTCTMLYGAPHRHIVEVDLTCDAFTRLFSSQKWWFIPASFVLPTYQLLPLLSLWHAQGKSSSLRITNRRGMAVIILGYDLKHSMWYVWEYARMHLYAFAAYGLSDPIVVAPFRVGLVILSVTFLIMCKPYTSMHRNVLLVLDIAWHVFHGMHLFLRGDDLGLSMFPSNYVPGYILFGSVYCLFIVLALAHMWHSVLTTWDPNRFNIDNNHTGGTSCWKDLYLTLFTRVAGIDPIIVGMGIGRNSRYIDLRKLGPGHVLYFTHVVGDALVKGIESQPKFAPSMLYVILEEAYRRAVAGRDGLIESRTVRRRIGHWCGPYNRDYSYTIEWHTDTHEVQNSLREGMRTVHKRLLDNKVVQPDEVLELLDTHMVMRDNMGHIIEDDVENVSRHKFPLQVRMESNRSVAVEELAVALADVCIDIHEGEPTLSSEIKTLQQGVDEAYDDILAALTETKEEQKKTEEENKLRRMGVLNLVMAAIGNKASDGEGASIADPLHPIMVVSALEEAASGAIGPRTRQTMDKVKAFINTISETDAMMLGKGHDANIPEDFTPEMVHDLASGLEITMPEASFVLGSIYAARSTTVQAHKSLAGGNQRESAVKSSEVQQARTGIFQQLRADKTSKRNHSRHTLRVKLLELDMLITESNRRGLAEKEDDNEMIRDCTRLVNAIEAKLEKEALEGRCKTGADVPLSDIDEDDRLDQTLETTMKKVSGVLANEESTYSLLDRSEHISFTSAQTSPSLDPAEWRETQGWGRVKVVPQAQPGVNISNFWRTVLSNTFKEEEVNEEGEVVREDDGISATRDDPEMYDADSSSSIDGSVVASTPPASLKPAVTQYGDGSGQTATKPTVDADGRGANPDTAVEFDGPSDVSVDGHHLASAMVPAPASETTEASVAYPALTSEHTEESESLGEHALNLPSTMFVYVGEQAGPGLRPKE